MIIMIWGSLPCVNSRHPGDARVNAASAPGRASAPNRRQSRQSRPNRGFAQIDGFVCVSCYIPPPRIGLSMGSFWKKKTPRTRQYLRSDRKRRPSTRENMKRHGGKRWPLVLEYCAQIDGFHCLLFRLWCQKLGRERSPEPPETPRHSQATPGRKKNEK